MLDEVDIEAPPTFDWLCENGSEADDKAASIDPEVDREISGRDCAHVACEESIRIFGRAAGVRVWYPTFVSGSGQTFLREYVSASLVAGLA